MLRTGVDVLLFAIPALDLGTTSIGGIAVATAGFGGYTAGVCTALSGEFVPTTSAIVAGGGLKLFADHFSEFGVLTSDAVSTWGFTPVAFTREAEDGFKAAEGDLVAEDGWEMGCSKTFPLGVFAAARVALMSSELGAEVDFFAATERDSAEMGAVALAAVSDALGKVASTAGAGKSFDCATVTVS